MSGGSMILAHTGLLLVLAATLAIGLRALAWIGCRDLDLPRRTVLGLGVGLGLCAAAVMWLGLADALRARWIALLLAAMLAAGARDLAAWARQALAALRTATLPTGARPHLALALLVCGAGWIFFRLPPVFFDALVYHVGLPQQYLVRGGLEYLPHSHYSALPANAEMLYTLGLGLSGEMLAQLLSWWIGMLAALSVAAECASLLPGAGWIGFAALAGMPVLLFMGAHSGTDHLVALFIFQALMSGRLWKERGEIRWLALTAALLGFAAGTKYTALYHAAPLALLWLGRGAGTSAPRALRRAVLGLAGRAAMVIAIGAALAGPWYVRNWLHTGNPVYPAFYSVLGGSDWSSESARKVAEDVRHGAGRDLTAAGVLSIPWDLVIHPQRFGALGEAGRGFWIFLLGAGYALLRRPDLRRLGVYAAMVLPFWLATSLNLRYILPLLSVVQMLAGVGLAELARRSRPAARLVALGCAACVAANLWVFLVTEQQVFAPARLLAGATDRDAYLQEIVTYYPAARKVNAELPQSARLLLVGETRVFYFERPVVASSAYDRAAIVDIVRAGGSVDGALCELSRRGFTHLVYNQPEADRLEAGLDYFSWKNDEERRIFNELPGRLRLWYAARWVFIFEVPPPPAGCLPA